MLLILKLLACDIILANYTESFLLLHGDQLLDGINGYVREFLKDQLA